MSSMRWYIALRRLSNNIIDPGKDLSPLFPFHVSDYIGFTLAILGLMVAAGGGIGGGGILVPIYLLILNFPIKHAIPLASATVLGGSIANTLLNCQKRAPHNKDLPVVDFDLLLMMEPLTIAGTLIGADLVNWLPDQMLILLLLIVLVISAYTSLKKAFELYSKEEKDLKRARGDEFAKENASYGTISEPKQLDDDNEALTSKINNVIPLEYIRGKTLTDIVLISSLFTVVTGLSLLKGTTAKGWLIDTLMLLIILAFAVWMRNRILGQTIATSSLQWNLHNTVQYPLLASGGGLVAGMFGIGGGIIHGPLMLAWGVDPAVASATLACMILFTTATATASFTVFGLLAPDYAAFCFAVGFLSTVAGQVVLSSALKGRKSFIAGSIGVVVALSAICMTIESLHEIIQT